MAGSRAALTIDVTADTSKAVGNLDKVEQAVKNYGDAADTATRQSRDVSGGIEATGSVAATATTGLRDLGGAMSEMGGTMGSVGDAMQTGAIAFEALDGAATLYAAAQGVASGAATVFNGIMNALRLTILSNPIFLIAAIIIAIGAAFVIAYTKCETFRNIVNAAVGAVWDVIKTVWNWISNNWPLLAAILMGPFGIAVLAIVRNWDTIEDAIRGVWNWINSVWHRLTDILTAPFEAAKNIIKGIIDTIKGFIQGVLDMIGRIKLPSLGDLNPFSRSTGGGGAVAFAAPGVARAPAATATSGATTINVNVTTRGLGADSPQIQRAVVNALRGHVARNGALDIPVRTGG